MNDYPELRLFPREGTEFLETLSRPVYGLVSLWWPGVPLTEVLTNHRDLHVQTADQFDRWIVYGDVGTEEQVLLLCNADSASNGDTRLLNVLRENARRYNQRGFVFAYRGEPTAKFLVPDDDYLDGKDLSKFDGSVAVFNEWADRILPGFKLRGYFPRDVLYVQRKLREHGIS